VLPKGVHRIRHYGLLANGNRAANIALASVPAEGARPCAPLRRPQGALEAPIGKVAAYLGAKPVVGLEGLEPPARRL
jgi:hypothetical protein